MGLHCFLKNVLGQGGGSLIYDNIVVEGVCLGKHVHFQPCRCMYILYLSIEKPVLL